MSGPQGPACFFLLTLNASVKYLQLIPIPLLLFAGSALRAQGSLGGVGENNGKFASQVLLSDTYGRPVKPLAADVDGSPFYTENYHYADLQLTNGRRFKSVKIRLDIDAQEMHFVAVNGVESLMEAGSVKEIVYADTAELITSYIFRIGYPAVEGKNERSFYQVLVNGKAELLRSVQKKITERKDEISGIVTKEYETREEYYLFIKGEMKRLKKDKNSLLAALSDQKAALEKYIEAAKLNPKNLQDIEKIIVYYNSL
jgi:hypothetical protein